MVLRSKLMLAATLNCCSDAEFHLSKPWQNLRRSSVSLSWAWSDFQPLCASCNSSWFFSSCLCKPCKLVISSSRPWFLLCTRLMMTLYLAALSMRLSFRRWTSQNIVCLLMQQIKSHLSCSRGKTVEGKDLKGLNWQHFHSDFFGLKRIILSWELKNDSNARGLPGLWHILPGLQHCRGLLKGQVYFQLALGLFHDSILLVLSRCLCSTRYPDCPANIQHLTARDLRLLSPLARACDASSYWLILLCLYKLRGKSKRQVQRYSQKRLKLQLL